MCDSELLHHCTPLSHQHRQYHSLQCSHLPCYFRTLHILRIPNRIACNPPLPFPEDRIRSLEYGQIRPVHQLGRYCFLHLPHDLPTFPDNHPSHPTEYELGYCRFCCSHVVRCCRLAHHWQNPFRWPDSRSFFQRRGLRLQRRLPRTRWDGTQELEKHNAILYSHRVGLRSQTLFGAFSG